MCSDLCSACAYRRNYKNKCMCACLITFKNVSLSRLKRGRVTSFFCVVEQILRFLGSKKTKKKKEITKKTCIYASRLQMYVRCLTEKNKHKTKIDAESLDLLENLYNCSHQAADLFFCGFFFSFGIKQRPHRIQFVA